MTFSRLIDDELNIIHAEIQTRGSYNKSFKEI